MQCCSTDVATNMRCLQLYINYTDSNKKSAGNESEANGDQNKLPKTADFRFEKPATTIEF
jgi:hypothetical protein